jgi:hypothetical protein
MVKWSGGWIAIFELEALCHLFNVPNLIDEYHAAFSVDAEAEEGRDLALIDDMELFTE